MTVDSRTSAGFRIGIDVGGTFTDLVITDGAGLLIGLYKSPTTPSDPVQGVLNVLVKAAARLDVSVQALLVQTHVLVHGTTIATNTLLTKTGCKTALITTDGFRDTLAIRRGKRDNIWDIRSPFPEPLVPRYLRLGIRERTDKHGQVIVPVNPSEVQQALEFLDKHNVEAVAVCLFNSFLNNEHETRIRNHIQASNLDLHASVSSEVLPLMGEYERTSTTVVDAYVAPRVASYLEQLEATLRGLGLQVPLLVTTNYGGVVRAQFCSHRPILTVLSGPAAGYPAANLYGTSISLHNLILLDMGGTSSDATVLVDGKARETNLTTIAGYEIAVRTVDIRTIGTGGGSIASVDSGGLLRVGPTGAGADPGPACYRRGGTLPTVTDAQLVLGRLNPNYFLGGELQLSLSAAKQAIQNDVASLLGLSVQEAAYAVVKIATQNMADAIRLAAVEQGIDLSDYVLIAAGGAAGLHAADVAAELKIERILVPRLAAGLCALGMLQADIVHDYTDALFGRWDTAILHTLGERFSRLEQQAAYDLAEEGFSVAQVRYERSADLRYVGQQWEIEVSLSNVSRASCIATAIEKYHELHESIYGHRNEGVALECIQIRVRAIGATEKPHLPVATNGPPPVPYEHRSAYVNRWLGDVQLPIFRGSQMSYASKILGPALIEEPTTTVLVPKEWELSLTTNGDYLLDKVVVRDAIN